MKEIKLTQGKVALVDDEDFEYLNQWKWFASKKKNNYYAHRKSSMRLGKRKTILMHREILNPTHGQEVDHIDFNGLNNQRSNIRLCTHRQNMCNRLPLSGSSSKYLGVSFDKVNKKWFAIIRIDGKNKLIGRFKTEENAATAYNIFAEKHHGEFARLNTANT